ncbi:MAG: hypothetical protein VYA32_04175 [Planctomycetota bacterium]|nr:hypothetical protein [Planctomycetota bacterium]
MQPTLSSTLVSALLVCVSCLGERGFAAQQRDIELLRPRSGQRGTTVEVILEGRDIGNPKEVLFYRPGIKAIDFEDMPPRKRNVSLHHGGIVRDRVKCRFVIAADCPLGEHALRLRTAETLSTVATFWVGPFPIVPELERGGFEVTYRGGETVVTANDKAIVQPNNSLKTAQEIPLNCTIAGQIKVTRELDDDYFRVQLEKGQRLSVEIDSVRLCDKAYAESEYDLMVRILDQDGKVLVEQDDSDLHVQDPIASLIAPHEGTYFIHIRQQLFKAGRWIYYRAHVGGFQRPLIAYPLGGRAGAATQLRLLGDPGGTTQQVVTLPAKPGDFTLFPGPKREQPPSGLPLRVSSYPNVLEKPDQVTPVQALPAALNGIIARPGQQDVFRFSVDKKKRYRVRVFARGLGSPLDTRIWFRHVSDEKNEMEADDATWADRGKPVVPNSLQRPELLDPSVIFAPRQDGEYLLGIADMRGLGGERFVYRVEIEPAQDVIHTHTVSWANDRFEINRTAGFIVPRNNRWTTNVYIAPERGNAYDGPLRLVPRGLPDGVTMTAPLFQPGMNGVPVQFVAAPGTRPQACLFSIDLVRTEGEGKIHATSQAYIPFINHSGGRSWHHAHLMQFALGVIDSSPFTVELEQPSIPISQSGELKLKVSVRRQNGFQGAIDIQPDWYPNGVSGGGAVTIPPEKSEVEYSLSASPRATPGTWKMTMNATTTGGDAYSGVGRVRVSSNVIELAVGSPYVALKFKPGAVRRGQVTEIHCDVKHLQPFKQPARARLVGIPKGVSLVGGQYLLGPGDKKIVFKLRASGEALLGRYAQMRCELTFQEAGQSIRQLTENGVLRVDPAVKD